jgi:2-amino-4-hydroxy-6-hydroxymethyldihydropteridine diphosphokinase
VNLVAIGSNLPAPGLASPLDVCAAALRELEAAGLRVVAASSWYETDPVPPSDQPRYVNGVAEIATDLGPEALLARLLAVEGRFGRERTVRDAARTLDLDLLAAGDAVRAGPAPPLLPHPRMHGRAFVLVPLAEIAPAWRHPVLGLTAAELLARLPDAGGVRRIAGTDPPPLQPRERYP